MNEANEHTLSSSNRRKSVAARKLREWRSELRLNQTEVAVLIDGQCQQKMISLWETGRTKPSLERALKLSEISRGRVPLKDWQSEDAAAS